MLSDPRTFARLLLGWFDANRRALPWRLAGDSPAGTRPDPYRVLVSESMLQQTQVATVIPYFNRFIARFPTLIDLATAKQDDVLRLWQGLGYYSRARNLHAAARQIVSAHGGVVPSDVAALLALPGVGRYTAGAIASIAFDLPAPILDGNVARVLCRLYALRSDPREPAARQRLWELAEEILPKKRLGDFNSALMELGAMVCTPRAPGCLTCPVRSHCRAVAAGIQDQIPPPRGAGPTPVHRRWTFCVRLGDRWLIEQRPPSGRWGGLWQFITVEAPENAAAEPMSPTRPPSTAKRQKAIAADRSEAKAPPEAKPMFKAKPPAPATVKSLTGLRVSSVRPLGQFRHALTHRRYEFDVFSCEIAGAAAKPAEPPRRWATLAELSDFAMSRPHVRIATMLGDARINRR